ncbi:MAG: QcrA and Rieske domain-containing protein [Planctomycetota bacterium]
MNEEAKSYIDLAEKLEATGDVSAVRTCLDLATAADSSVRTDARFEALHGRMATFIDRRRLLGASAGLLAALLTGGVGLSGLLYLLPPKRSLTSEPVVKLGKEEAFGNDAHRIAEYRGRPILVIRDAEGEFHALSAICTHSEVCLLAWQAETQEIVCPCHRAAFDLRGNVIEGPPPRPLPTYKVLIQNGIVCVKIG